MATEIPQTFPQDGLGETEAYEFIEDLVRRTSSFLGAPDALAHMDPAPADIAARLVGLNAQFNQNLLHPDLSPFATTAERCVIDWLAPEFGMTTGHMCAGSTLANLTALWCAREHGATRVITSADAHISVPKSAAILGLSCDLIPVDETGRIAPEKMPDTTDVALVLTAGTTGRGVIDRLDQDAYPSRAAWVHVDAAWAGPLRLTERYKGRLEGIQSAHSVCISAHKWLFQPKDSALVLFRDPDAHNAISYGGAYLATPNVGVQGSRSAAGVALLGTLLAWGRRGLDERLCANMEISERLADRLEADPRAELRQMPEAGVLNWRPVPRNGTEQDATAERLIRELGPTASRTLIDDAPWVRQVAANMFADLDAVWEKIDRSFSAQ